MAPRAAIGLPSPPADLDQRKLPLKLLEGPLFRIHRTSLGCPHFGKNTSGRFDDPLGKYGVLYAALRAEAAFAEVFLRRLSLMLIRELDLQERSISEISCNRVHCVDLTGAGLRTLSCDNRIATEKPYDTVGQWSRALFMHPRQPDGIIYRSRHNPQVKCVALFERCQSRLKLGVTEGLMFGARRTWTIGQIDKYKLAIEPST
ncbi:RES domain protein [Verrucomicrobia bacterium]|nr:RES domain protein [Verrucomicrobiota bacterium]